MRNVSFTLLVMTAVWKSNVTGSTLRQNPKEELEFELLKKIEIERLKVQIVQELGLKETPGPSEAPVKLPDDVVQMLLAENEPKSKPPKRMARLLFSPTNENLQCFKHKEESCRRFEFNIPPDMIYQSTEFWMYQIRRVPSENQTISALCSHRGEELEHLMERDEYLDDGGEEKWLTFHLPLLQELRLWTGRVACAIEITGTIIDEEQNLPFLKITQDLEVLSRNRRSEDDGLEELDACRPVPFVVSFNEIGFSQHFSYPDSFNAYICKGYCLKSSNFYETILGMVFNKNQSLATEYGLCWATSCRPTEFENMDVIFRSKIEGGAVHNVTTLTNIIAKTCTCR